MRRELFRVHRRRVNFYMNKTNLAEAMSGTDVANELVQIALRNGKTFEAEVLDVLDGGEAIYIQRFFSRRKEVLRFGWGLGDVSMVAPMGVRKLYHHAFGAGSGTNKVPDARRQEERNIRLHVNYLSPEGEGLVNG